jgi:D-glycero-alpha-D-manno-heptose-7-phosphate kinase
MIISRTPFRVSFIGGGTDLPEFYSKEPGAVVSCAIDKYMYICVSPNFHKQWKVSYSKTEYADSIDEIQHPIVRECLKRSGIDEPLDIVSISDMPSGSGIGSSSAYTVGLLKALQAYKKITPSKEALAQMACVLEIDVLGKPIGQQDQYASVFGGLNYMLFNEDNTVDVERICYPWQQVLADSLVLMFTGDTRQAGSILTKVKKSVNKNRSKLRLMAELAEMCYGELMNNCPPIYIAGYLNKGWNIKRELADTVSSPRIEFYREKAFEFGALGSKLLGAGKDGFMLFYCTKDKQPGLKAAFPEMTFVNFNIDNDGSRILYRG